MVRVKVLRPHGQAQGLGVWRRGEEYLESPLAAAQKVAGGFVEYVGEPPHIRTKEDQDMYRTRSFSVPARPEPKPEPVVDVTLVERSGNWYTFSDGEKVLGKRAVAEKLGISPEDVEALSVDSDDD